MKVRGATGTITTPEGASSGYAASRRSCSQSVSADRTALRYQVVGIGILVAAIISTATTTDQVPSGKYYMGYYLFMLVGLSCAAVMSIVVAVFDVLAYNVRTPLRSRGWYRLRMING